MKKEHCDVCEYPLPGGKATHVVPSGMFCSIRGPHLSGLINNKLRLTADKNGKG